MIEVTHRPDSSTPAVVVVELERASTPDLARLLRTAIGTGDIGVIVDLGERGDASSELLLVLHRTARQLRTLGGRLAVVSTKPGDELSQAKLVIGRSQEADIVLDDPSISRRHCVIEARKGVYHARNISASNPLTMAVASSSAIMPCFPSILV